MGCGNVETIVNNPSADKTNSYSSHAFGDFTQETCHDHKRLKISSRRTGGALFGRGEKADFFEQVQATVHTQAMHIAQGDTSANDSPGNVQAKCAVTPANRLVSFVSEETRDSPGKTLTVVP